MTILSSDTFSIAIKAAYMGGLETLRFFGKDYKISLKEDKSPVTEADELSNEAILNVLADHTPKIPVISEESTKVDFEIRKNWESCWIVDPIDGTKEFMNQSNEYGVMVGLATHQKIKAGAIYLPKLDSLYVGAEGLGSYKIQGISKIFNEKISMDEITEIVSNQGIKIPAQSSPEIFTLLQSKSHLTDKDRSYGNKLRQKHPDMEIVRKGSCLKYCFLAEGKAHEYSRFQAIHEWDVAAGHAIVQFAGGKLEDIETSEEITYNSPNFKCSPFKATLG